MRLIAITVIIIILSRSHFVSSTPTTCHFVASQCAHDLPTIDRDQPVPLIAQQCLSSAEREADEKFEVARTKLKSRREG